MSPEVREQPIAIGQIVGAHGVDGEVKVYPLTDVPERFRETPWVFVGESGIRTRVLDARPHQRLWLLKLENVLDRTAAEKLKNAYLRIPASQVLRLPDDRFYEYQLIGCETATSEGLKIGIVKSLITGPANDVLVIGRTDGGEVLVPFVRQFIRYVDIAAKRIVIDTIPGLVDEGGTGG